MTSPSETPLDLDLIEARAEIATPGPWKTWAMSVLADPVGDSNLATAIPVADTHFRNADGRPRTNDADFIAAAREDVPALARRIRELEARPRTVGDLTARDLGRRVRIGPWPREATFSVEGKVLSLDMHHGRETIVMLYDGLISPWPLDTPVEFLDDETANAHQQPGERLPSHEQAAQVLGDPEECTCRFPADPECPMTHTEEQA